MNTLDTLNAMNREKEINRLMDINAELVRVVKTLLSSGKPVPNKEYEAAADVILKAEGFHV